MSAGASAAELRRAVQAAQAGDWQGAHAIVQRFEGDATADWIHAVVHRIEGDLDNARYWYGRCGRRLPRAATPAEELADIAAALETAPGR